MADTHSMIDSRQSGAATLRAILLLFTGSLLVLVLIAGFITSFGYFRTYVSEQLAGHAHDGATAVGMSLSNAIDARDPVAASSLIDAVFDSGRYLSVRYLNHQGAEVAGRAVSQSIGSVPEWFQSVANLKLPVAEAEVIRGWSRLGKVRVISNPGGAYKDLWRLTIGLITSTAIIGGVGLFALYLLLKQALRPLKALELQAQALGQRNFRQRVAVKSTRELNQVTAAMNQMANDLGPLFEGQSKLIQHLQRMNSEDPVTGLPSRNAFDQRLKAEVESEEKAAPGVLILVRLSDFADYNQAYGRSEADRVLLRVAEVVNEFVTSHVGSFAGRRNGAELSIFVPGALPADASIWCRELVARLDGLYADLAAPLGTTVHAGLARTADVRDIKAVLAAAEEALLLAQESEESCCYMVEPDKDGHQNLETWRVIISQAIRDRKLSWWLQPMVGEPQMQPVYHQVFSRLEGPEGTLKAGAFIYMAERFGLISDIDRMLVQRVLNSLAEHPDRPLAISLGSSSVASEPFRKEFVAQLEVAGRGVGNLWVGISEHTIHHHRTAVGLLVRALVRLGVSVLVDKFGVGGLPFNYLRNLSVQALRIDNSFIHDIDTHEENRFYLESVVSIAHSRGVKVFAAGVETAAEYAVLGKLGIDGAMGYHLGRPFAAGQQPTGE